MLAIMGPSGSGKEPVVRAIHDGGPHHEAPFVAINCGAIPELLAESELFGSDKGAFTGADRKRNGYFATVGCGTLFFDEIAELPLALQAKLLRVLQACYESWSRGSAAPEQRSICHSWLTGPYQELFGETFHQGRLRTLARMGFLREDDSSRGGHRRYYTIPDPDRVAAILKREFT